MRDHSEPWLISPPTESQLAQVGAAIEKDVREVFSGAGMADKYSTFEACIAKKVS